MWVYPATAPSPKVSTLLTNSTPVKATSLQDLHDRIYEQAQALIARRQGARPDGMLVDLSQFLAYAALNKDRRLYPLRDFAVRHLILNSSDPYTGFVSGATGRVLLQMHQPPKPCPGPKPLVG